MIRIYLDWNVISNLKRPEFKELKDFIDVHKDYLQFPYSPAHFSDLMKSYSPDNEYFQVDLEMLEYLSEKHLIRWEKSRTIPLFGTPKEYFEGAKNQEDIFSLMDIESIISKLDEECGELGIVKVGKLLKSIFASQSTEIVVNDDDIDLLQKVFPNITSNSSLWDFMKDLTPFTKNLLQNKEYYKDLRKSLGDKGLKLDPRSGNWSEEEVISNIDRFLGGLGTNMTFLEYVEYCFKHKKEGANQYELFTSAYCMLDMIGYKADKLPKPTDNLQNIQIDGEHAFYAAHCDYFVVGDKKLRTKSKVLYTRFNISTQVLSPEDLVKSLEKVIHQIPANTNNIFKEAFNLIKYNNIIASYPLSDDNQAEIHVIKLPLFYFNFFNYVVYRYYPSNKGVVLTFTKIFKNYSDFIYYTESERLIKRITDSFGYDNKEELETKIYECVYNNKDIQVGWNFENGQILLEKEAESNFPTLSYLFLTGGNEETD